MTYMAPIEMPWVVKDEMSGHCVRYSEHAKAMSYAHVAGFNQPPGRFAVYDSRKPHFVRDLEAGMHAAFETKEQADGYIERNNRYQGRDRFAYEFLALT